MCFNCFGCRDVQHLACTFRLSSCLLAVNILDPFRTAVSFWGQFGTNYLEFDWCVPKTGLEF